MDPHVTLRSCAQLAVPIRCFTFFESIRPDNLHQRLTDDPLLAQPRPLIFCRLPDVSGYAALLLRRFSDRTRRASPGSRHVLVIVLLLPAEVSRRSNQIVSRPLLRFTFITTRSLAHPKGELCR
jgi:hypothetical protein